MPKAKRCGFPAKPAPANRGSRPCSLSARGRVPYTPVKEIEAGQLSKESKIFMRLGQFLGALQPAVSSAAAAPISRNSGGQSRAAI
jgi:hypothetical protein